MINVYLKKKEDKRIRAGHPWVYANEVERIEGKGGNGELCAVYDCAGELLGKGFINHTSKILVRIFLHGDEEFGVELLKDRIRRADDYRQKLGCGESYRMVFAEADDLPALIVDRYGDVLSVQLLSLGMDKHRQEIIQALTQLFSPRGIYERSDVEVRRKEGLPLTKGKLYGDFSPRVTFTENGLKMTADLENGQKTGYFLDQRENRLAIRRYCAGARVLDCFCNVGGFSLNAAAGGAASVTAVDVSQRALDEVKVHAGLNGFEDKIETVCADVFDKLREYKRNGESFDVVILDPPAFCKSAADVKNAYRGYKDINLLGMKLVTDGGTLITASCSHYMTATLFEKMLREAAKESGRRVRTVEVKTQAPDHPALLAADETNYLKFYVLQITDRGVQ